MNHHNPQLQHDDDKVVDSLLSSAELFKYRLNELEIVKSKYDKLLVESKDHSTTIQHLETKCNTLNETLIDMEKSNDYLQRKIGRLNIQLSNLTINWTREQKRYKKLKDKCDLLNRKQHFMVTESRKILDKVSDVNFTSIKNYNDVDDNNNTYIGHSIIIDNIDTDSSNTHNHQDQVSRDLSSDDTSSTDEDSLMNESMPEDFNDTAVLEASFSEITNDFTPILHSNKENNNENAFAPQQLTSTPLSKLIQPLNPHKINYANRDNIKGHNKRLFLNNISASSSISDVSRIKQPTRSSFHAQLPISNSRGSYSNSKSHQSPVNTEQSKSIIDDNYDNTLYDDDQMQIHEDNSRLVKFIFTDNESLRDILDSPHISMMFKKITDEVLTFNRETNLQVVFDKYQQFFFKKMNEGHPSVMDKLKEDIFLKFYVKGKLIKNYKMKLSDLDDFLSFDNVLILNVSGF